MNGRFIWVKQTNISTRTERSNGPEVDSRGVDWQNLDRVCTEVDAQHVRTKRHLMKSETLSIFWVFVDKEIKCKY